MQKLNFAYWTVSLFNLFWFILSIVLLWKRLIYRRQRQNVLLLFSVLFTAVAYFWLLIHVAKKKKISVNRICCSRVCHPWRISVLRTKYPTVMIEWMNECMQKCTVHACMHEGNETDERTNALIRTNKQTDEWIYDWMNNFFKDVFTFNYTWNKNIQIIKSTLLSQLPATQRQDLPNL